MLGWTKRVWPRQRRGPESRFLPGESSDPRAGGSHRPSPLGGAAPYRHPLASASAARSRPREASRRSSGRVPSRASAPWCAPRPSMITSPLARVSNSARKPDHLHPGTSPPERRLPSRGGWWHSAPWRCPHAPCPAATPSEMLFLLPDPVPPPPPTGGAPVGLRCPGLPAAAAYPELPDLAPPQSRRHPHALPGLRPAGTSRPAAAPGVGGRSPDYPRQSPPRGARRDNGAGAVPTGR